MNTVVARHGDMVIFRVSKEKAKDLTPRETKNLTLGLGETTGHSHEVVALDESVIIEHHNIVGYDSKELKELVGRDSIVFEIKGSAVIVHDEHEPIILEEGYYIRTVQRQYNPFSKSLQKVRD